VLAREMNRAGDAHMLNVQRAFRSAVTIRRLLLELWMRDEAMPVTAWNASVWGVT